MGLVASIKGSECDSISIARRSCPSLPPMPHMPSQPIFLRGHGVRAGGGELVKGWDTWYGQRACASRVKDKHTQMYICSIRTCRDAGAQIESVPEHRWRCDILA